MRAIDVKTIPSNREIEKTRVISGFPGIGKTTAMELLRKQGLFVSDSDSSGFDRADWPNNYMNHLLSLMGEMDLVLVSSHEEVWRAMSERGIEFTMVYPDKSLKEEYLQRYKDRGSDENFIKLLDSKWDEWIDTLNDWFGSSDNKVVLQSGEYLTDALNQIVNKEGN